MTLTAWFGVLEDFQCLVSPRCRSETGANTTRHDAQKDGSRQADAASRDG